MREGHKDWVLRFEATPEVAEEIQEYIHNMTDVWRIDLEDVTDEPNN